MQKIIDDIKATIDKVPVLDVTTAEYGDTEIIDCRMCEGEGEVSQSSYVNVDGLPLNIDFTGIGESQLNAEQYLISVSPDKVKKLLEYIDDLEDKVLFLESNS